MARASHVETLMGGLPAELRRVFRAIFDYVLTGLRLGRAVADQRAENLQLYFLQGTTASTPGDEFTLPHGLGRAPYLLVPALPLDEAGGQLVPLTVSRVADAHRVYLTSTVADAPITVMIEG